MFRTVLRIGSSLGKHRTLFTFAACSSKNFKSVASSLKNSGRAPSDVCRFTTLRYYSTYIEATDDRTSELMKEDIRVIEDFVSAEEEQLLIDEVEPHLTRLRYQKDHWDDAIQGYRETEKKKWREKNTEIIERIRTAALPKAEEQIAFVHVLDLAEDGYIKPHIDSVRFCGSTIAGLSLLSSSVMRFVHEKDKSSVADVLLKRRSLYIIQGHARYHYTHEIRGGEHSIFRGEAVPKGRRVSVICRTEPDPSKEQPENT